MSLDKFPYRPKLNEEDYAIVLVALFDLLKNPKNSLTIWAYGYVKLIGEKEGWSEEQIQAIQRLLVRHLFLEGRELWMRLLERRPHRRTDKMIRKHFGKSQSYDDVLKRIKQLSNFIAKGSRRGRDELLLKLKEEKEELGIL